MIEQGDFFTQSGQLRAVPRGEGKSIYDVEPLSFGGVEEVRRHPASRAEMALVSTIDELRREVRRFRKEMQNPSPQKGPTHE